MYIVQVQIHVGLHVGYIFVPLIREKSQYEIEDNELFSRLSNNERTCRSQENKKKFKPLVVAVSNNFKISYNLTASKIVYLC